MVSIEVVAVVETNKRNIKICIIGHFGGDKKFTDGQTVKTKEIQNFLVKYGYVVSTVDTYFLKRNPVIIFMRIYKAMNNNDVILLVVSFRGYKILSPIIVKFNRYFKRKIFDFVIGGSRFKLFDKNKKLKKYARSFNGIYVETDRIMREYKKRGINNVKVIPNFKNLAKKPKKIDYSKKKQFNVCTFGRVIKEKGILDAVTAIKMANFADNDIFYHVDVYGNIKKRYENEFNDLLKNNRKFLSYKGTVDFNDAPKVLSNYDTLLFPTYWDSEGFPGVLIDALFASIPVIATDWNDNFEILEENKNAIKVGIRSPGEIAQAMIKLAHDKKLFVDMSEQNSRLASKYLPKTAMKPFLDELNSIEDGDME